MKTFRCVCGNAVYFQNSYCRHCGRGLGFAPNQLQVCSIEPAGVGLFRALPPAYVERLYRPCRNYSFDQVCNWLIEAGDDEVYCKACRLNDTIPNLSVTENRVRWYRIEDAKRRLLYSLYRLKLPVIGRSENPQNGLSFAFLADANAGEKVYTGHDGGLITINVAEADDCQREFIRESMGERYRTLLGHFRHEIGHYYWTQLIEHTSWLAEFRQLFGDEQVDYEQCKSLYYEQGAPTEWQERFVTAYASMHPLEDWAESWAHYLHIADTLETAADFELSLGGVSLEMPGLLLDSGQASSERSMFDRQLSDWARMALCINAINRSLGLADPYPFVLSEPIHDKLFFIHRVLAAAAFPQGSSPLPGTETGHTP